MQIREQGCTNLGHLVSWVTECFMGALNTVSIIVAVFFSLNVPVCISLHVPSRKRKITGHSQVTAALWVFNMEFY